MSPPKLPPRAAQAAAGALLALHAVLCWLARAPGIETGRDDAKYLLLGRALRHLSYREIWNPSLPIHAQYPPGYPAALALWGGLVGEHYDRLIVLNIAASVAALFLAWHVIRRGWGEWYGLAALAALATNPYLVWRAGQLMSEPLFMALSVAAVALLFLPNPSPRRLAAAGALAIAASLTRSVGIALLPAIGLLWLVQRRWKALLAFTVAAALTSGGWLLWTIVGGPRVAGESYVGDVMGAGQISAAEGGRLGVLVSHVTDYLSTSLPLVMPVPTVPGMLVDNVVGALLATVGLLAGLVVLWKRWPAAALHLAFGLALLVVWPWTETRFFGPLIPVLVPAVLVGLGTAAAKLPGRTEAIVVAALALLFAATGVARTAPLVAQRLHCDRGITPPDASCVGVNQAGYFEAVRYVRDHLPPDALLVSAKPEPVYVYTGRRAIIGRAILAADSLSAGAAIRGTGAGWVLLSSLQVYEPRRMRPRLSNACTQLAVEAAFPPSAYLLRVLPGAGTDSTACRALQAYARDNLGRNFAEDW